MTTTWLVIGVALLMPTTASSQDAADLRQEFSAKILPFVETYCQGCHADEKPKAQFDLSPYTTIESVIGDLGHWETVLKRLRAGEMPPKKAKRRPKTEARNLVIAWIERLRRQEAERNAGDPGAVLVRRLSNAEYNYTIHDLTGIDIQPTREFPVDPANEAGFDNSGESLGMSPALFEKYLDAARSVAKHLFLLPDGLDFAPHPVVVYSDRDKFAVHRIVDFYKQQPIDYADYFLAAWRFRHRLELGSPNATMVELAGEAKISSEYLTTLWSVLTNDDDNFGPLQSLRERWNDLPVPTGPITYEPRLGCEGLRDFVLQKREEFKVPVDRGKFRVTGMNESSQPLILWMNREIASRRRAGKLPPADGSAETDQLRSAISQFCDVFPDTFYVSERGRMSLPPQSRNKGRLLNAGFHLMVGYFRDDAPLYDLVLDGDQQRMLDKMWAELDFLTLAPKRQFSDYVYFERAEGSFLKSAEFDFAREDDDVTSEIKMQRLADLYVEKAGSQGIDPSVVGEIEAYFKHVSTNVRRLEKTLAAAEPRHIQAMLSIGQRAWRRPLTELEQDDLRGLYQSLRDEDGLSHGDALRDVLVTILMSPYFSYRTEVAEPGESPRFVSDYELASRLSYFLWSSSPDSELLLHAAQGTLHSQQVLAQQSLRMIKDPRARHLAVEFGGNWLDFRRFEQHNGVNRQRLTQFNDYLRQAMYEEPIRFFNDLLSRNGSILEFLEADHTFVNPVLAMHYGMPVPPGGPDQWLKIGNARRFGRGGLLPMGVFLTKNSPGLRTSPVKRGYWVVRRLLGEQIPPPPPEVPELPEDESKLGELSLRDFLAKHRESESCAACHQRFDSFGLVFEGYGPIGERREKDLGGRDVDDLAEFPDGSRGQGFEGLRQYIRSSRQTDFVDNFCRKLLAYALGRTLLLSDESTIGTMKDRLVENDYRITSVINAVITSPQFLRKRGRDYVANR